MHIHISMHVHGKILERINLGLIRRKAGTGGGGGNTSLVCNSDF